MRALSITLLVAALLALAGCGPALTVTRINSEQQKPNNVWVFFTVERGSEPIGNLKAEDFNIYEDDKLVSVFESKQTIQNPKVAAVMYTLLLLDVSGSITESGQIGPVVDAASQFTETVGKTQKVAVYAFDGSDKIRPVVPFTETEGAVQGGLEGLRTYKPKDPSTNLHGAVVQGLQELKAALAKEKKPLRFGTLVVFSDGADRAARITREQMMEELRKKDYERFDLFAIGIGDDRELSQARLADIGRDGTEQGNDRTKVKQSFESIASKIEAHSKRFYLLSYCTPSRKAAHRVRIEAQTREPKASGSLEYEFTADGFGPPPDCDPARQPSFKLDKVEAPAPAAPATPRAKTR